MDVYAALGEVARWSAERTARGDPDRIETDCHATLCITIGESAPPWELRLKRRDSTGASAPLAQLRYDCDRREWALHHGARGGWCSDDDAEHSKEIGPLLDLIEADRTGRFVGLPPGFRWRFRSW
jgi:hypothetical protein